MKVPPFHIAPGTELRIRGQLQVIEKLSDDGRLTLLCPVRQTRVEFELPELVSMRMNGTLVPVHLAPERHRVSGIPTYLPLTKVNRPGFRGGRLV